MKELEESENEVKRLWKMVKKRWEIINRLQSQSDTNTPEVIHLATPHDSE